MIRRCSWTRKSVRDILDWCYTSPVRPYDPDFSCVRFAPESFSPATVCPACSNRRRRNVQYEKEVVGREVRFESARVTPTRYNRVYERDDSAWREPPRYSRLYEQDASAWRTPPRPSRVYERDVHRTYETAKPSGRHQDRVKEELRCRERARAYASTAKYALVHGASFVGIAVGTHCLVEVIDKVYHCDKRR